MICKPFGVEILRLILALLFLSCLPFSHAKGGPQGRLKSDSTKAQSTSANKPRPKQFRDFADCVGWLRKSVYLIARGRPTVLEGKPFVQWTTLGTGFLAAPYRLLTASHVIDDPEKDELHRHKPGDVYYLLKNQGDVFHWRTFSPKLDQELFLYPEVDVAVMYLDEMFYITGAAFGLSKNEYLRMDLNFLPIGSQVGVMGYPLSKLEFNDRDARKPRAGDVFLRADLGVVNTRYKITTGLSVYEFTMMFNPGNSGGPIFETKTGKVVSLVRAYRSIAIKTEEKLISEAASKTLKVYKERAYIDVAHSTYSIGTATATPALIDVLKKHGVIK